MQNFGISQWERRCNTIEPNHLVTGTLTKPTPVFLISLRNPESVRSVEYHSRAKHTKPPRCKTKKRLRFDLATEQSEERGFSPLPWGNVQQLEWGYLELCSWIGGTNLSSQIRAAQVGGWDPAQMPDPGTTPGQTTHWSTCAFSLHPSPFCLSSPSPSPCTGRARLALLLGLWAWLRAQGDQHTSMHRPNSFKECHKYALRIYLPWR